MENSSRRHSKSVMEVLIFCYSRDDSWKNSLGGQKFFQLVKSVLSFSRVVNVLSNNVLKKNTEWGNLLQMNSKIWIGQ